MVSVSSVKAAATLSMMALSSMLGAVVNPACLWLTKRSCAPAEGFITSRRCPPAATWAAVTAPLSPVALALLVQPPINAAGTAPSNIHLNSFIASFFVANLDIISDL